MSAPVGERADAAAALARITAEERELVFPRFDRETGWALGVFLRDAALARELPVVVGVTLAGQRLFHAALPGAAPDNDAWLDRKAAAVVHFQRSSLGVREQFRAAGRDYATDSRLDHALVAANGGVFPITVAGVGVVGTVGVSGLPQVEDHAFVVKQLRAFLAD
ncbi:heme-degrading domain-containing protein [Blastococcus sp. SYSU DS0619]